MQRSADQDFCIADPQAHECMTSDVPGTEFGTESPATYANNANPGRLSGQ